MEITAKTAEMLRLTAEEFEHIQFLLGRTPNFTELCAFSGMWSEHCSYKNSIRWLKTLPRTGARVLAAAGEENAGLMDIGDGMAVVFKIESHNHPSAIEPFQGAATGVGGIHRDIFTMGARPIAALNSLRFGKLQETKTQHLLAGVVHGIGHYGNCFGVPTVGGEAYFDSCYHTNPLVNAMSVGIVQAGKTISAIAKGTGNSIFIVGSATGRDGIGGASFASANITADSVKDLPAVQVGDPFQEKKLLEACMELAETDALVGMQDMGAAGIICSTAEMSAKGNVGMKIQLEKVPARQENMQSWELLLSESQERMLLCVQQGKEDIVLKIFDKWDVACAQIGVVTDNGILEFYMNNTLEASIPAKSLVLGGDAPVYERSYAAPAYLQKIQSFDASAIAVPNNLIAVAERIIQLPNIASKRWIYTQYDSMVGTGNASVNEPSDAAIVLVKGTTKGIAMTVDCNSRYVYADPYKGAMIAVSEAARNIVCSGGEPLGVTNCLNFGNPYDPEVYWQFVHAIRGMGDACRSLQTPVTGGNVSFYNQNPDGPVYPTPTIGMVGIVADIKNKMTLHFKQPGDIILLIGKSSDDMYCSEYLHTIHDIAFSPAPHFDMEEEMQLQKTITHVIKNKLILSAHDVSEGGLFVTLCESGFKNNLGFHIQTDKAFRKDAFLFGEGQSRAIVSVSKNHLTAVTDALQSFKATYTIIGEVTNNSIMIDNQEWGSIENWKSLYDTAIERHLSKEVTV